LPVPERRLFGTDGVRGVVGEDLTGELVSGLGRAFAEWSGTCPVLVGRDTRASGASLELAVSDGLRAGGSPVRWGGILPTPAVALLAGPDGCGAVVSASHNPPEYNGVKLFGRGGWKLTDEEEAAIELLVDPTAALDRPEPEWPEPDLSLRERYEDIVVERFGGPLPGLRVVCDCANGALTGVAQRAFERAGARVKAIGDEPDGMNINVGCGATDLALLRETVRSGDHDLGVAFDGDGDRVLAVDAAGEVVDGDAILAILALHLRVELVAVTTMTNLGFHRLMEERGVRVLTTDVGDRYVLEALRREGGTLGGEQSGHLILLDGHVSGDGLAAALLLARAVAESGRTLTDLAAVLERYPQAKANVTVARKELTPALRGEVERANRRLGSRGRVLVRPSGTEPVVRVLAEAESAQAADDLCSTIAEFVARELG
jgi:phosphoglucosamine mutase